MAEILVPEKLKANLSTLRTTMGRRLLSAMIGAGFSFNAEKRDSTAVHVSWEKLGEKIEEALCELNRNSEYPKNSGIFDPEKILATAQEYKELASNTPGAKTLDDLIYEISSYEDFEPGLLHKKLLSLHWNDIYTTNYDCLLERTQIADQKSDFPIIRQPYNIIREGTELPHGKPEGTRRIIKLHGSFPLPNKSSAVKPYLLAKDDYESYQVNNQLFVQEVQSALVNDTFCLIGFSGTDPNFRSWVTWVSEELKGKQPKLYIISFEEPTAEEEKYFTTHNIIDVNIAFLTGVTQCNSHAERQSALHAFFTYLKVEYPEEPLWSYKNASLPKFQLGKSNSINEYCDAASALREQRESYPNWIFPPLEILENALEYFSLHVIPNWPRLLLNIDHNPEILTKWLISYEYLWAYDTFCIPFIELLEEDGFTALVTLFDEVWDLQYSPDINNKLRELPESIQLSLSAFCTTLQDAGCMLQRLFRHYGVYENVSYIRKKMDESLNNRPNIEAEHWSIYNDILCCLESCDRAGAKSLIDSWNVDEGSIYWKTRKANLLAELEKTEESQRLLLDALFEIRNDIHQHGSSPCRLSCEAWTERFLEVINQYRDIDSLSTTPSELASKPNEEGDNGMLSRTLVLRRLGFHPLQILQELGKRLHTLARLQAVNEPQIDVLTGSEIPDRTVRSGLPPGLHEPYIFLGILERTGLPPRIGIPRLGGGVSNTMWINAATALFRVYRSHHPFIFLIIHRILNPDVFKKNQVIFSRYALANLDREHAKKLFDQAFPLLTKLYKSYDTDIKKGRRNSLYLIFLLQYVALLCPLLDQGRISKILSSLQDWYAQGALFSLDTADTFLKTLNIAIKSTSMADLRGRLESLLSLPLVPQKTKKMLEVKGYSPIQWPTLFSGRKFQSEDADWDTLALKFLQDIQREEEWLREQPTTPNIPPANALTKEIANEFEKFRWDNVVNESIERKVAILSPYWSTLVWMQESNLLTEKSILPITQHLWNSYPGIAPEIPGYLQSTACLVFPDTDQGQCFNAYVGHLFSSTESQSSHESKYWYNSLGVSLAVSKRFPLSDNRLGLLLNHLHRETIPPAPQESLFGRHPDPPLSYINKLLLIWGQKGLLRSNLTRDCLLNWLELLKKENAQYNYSTAVLDVLSLELTPRKKRDLINELRTRLFVGPMRQETGHAVLYWKYCFSSTVSFPEDSTDMLADCFKNMNYPEAMDLVPVFFSQVDKYEASLSESEIAAILVGLERIKSALDYKIPYHERFPGEHPPPQQLSLKIPYHREQIARFLEALIQNKPSLQQNSVVSSWLVDLGKDPLADIRNILM